MKKIKLDEILEAIDFQTEECLAVINKRTGEVSLLTEEVIMCAQTDSEYGCVNQHAKMTPF